MIEQEGLLLDKQPFFGATTVRSSSFFGFV